MYCVFLASLFTFYDSYNVKIIDLNYMDEYVYPAVTSELHKQVKFITFVKPIRTFPEHRMFSTDKSKLNINLFFKSQLLPARHLKNIKLKTLMRFLSFS